MSNQNVTIPEVVEPGKPLTPAERLAQAQQAIVEVCQRLGVEFIANPKFVPDGTGGWRPLSPIEVQISIKG